MKKYQKKNKAFFAGALFSVLISTVFAVVLQFFKGDVLDHALAGETDRLAFYVLLLILCILGEVLFYFCYAFFSAKFTAGCTRLLKHDIFESIMHRGYAAYKKHPEGEYIAKYVNESDAIKARRFQLLPAFWEIFFKIIFVSTALFALDWRIAFITIILLTTPLYIPKLIEKRLQKAQNEYLKASQENLAKVNDWLNGFEVIKNFSVERKIIDKFDETNDKAMGKMLRDATLAAQAQLITTLISYLSYFIVLSCSAWLVLRGDFSAGDFFVAVGMIDQLSYPLISLAGIIRQLVAVKPVCREMEAFIAEGTERKKERTLETCKEKIQYSNVSFSYPDNPPVLQNFDFTAYKGKHYLLKGPSGCGKTTAVNLLLRYYDVDRGTIMIDGVPVSQYDNIYGCVTVVRQEATLFHDSLRNNLTMYQEIPDEKLIAMLKKLGLEQFAERQALDRIIGENGFDLSGGEKKRVCLARALLRDTDILILDEPLANLDEPTAKKIEDLILKIRDKLVLIVSHQFTEEKIDSFDSVLTFRAG